MSYIVETTNPLALLHLLLSKCAGNESQCIYTSLLSFPSQVPPSVSLRSTDTEPEGLTSSVKVSSIHQKTLYVCVYVQTKKANAPVTITPGKQRLTGKQRLNSVKRSFCDSICSVHTPKQRNEQNRRRLSAWRLLWQAPAPWKN